MSEKDGVVLIHTYELITGPVLTGGEKVDGKWLWEQVTEEPQSDDVTTSETLSTFLTPIEHFMWFPGKVVFEETYYYLILL